MLLRQHHLHLPTNKHTPHTNPQVPFACRIPSRQLIGQSHHHGVFLYRWAHKKTSLYATAEQANLAPSEIPSNWREPLDPMLWHGSENEAKKRLPADMAPPWKVMLLSDGSVTRHLQLLTDLPVQVDCLEMRCVGRSLDGLPQAVENIPGPRTQRQVLLRLPDKGNGNRAMVYASSWWDAAHVSEYLKDTSRPIWESLSQGRTELYRDIQQVYCGHSAYLEEQFQARGPFWGRHYVFWHNGKPLTLIYEVFSTALEFYLGPCGSQQHHEHNNTNLSA